MARYFDTADAAHVALLPYALREDSELSRLAAAAEQLVLTAYTQPMQLHPCAVRLDAGLATERWVHLAGYTEDAAAAPAHLADALRLEVVGMVRWLAAREAKKPGVQSESAGDPKTAKGYTAGADKLYPPDFGQALAAVQLRPVSVYI